MPRKGSKVAGRREKGRETCGGGTNETAAPKISNERKKKRKGLSEDADAYWLRLRAA